MRKFLKGTANKTISQEEGLLNFHGPLMEVDFSLVKKNCKHYLKIFCCH